MTILTLCIASQQNNLNMKLSLFKTYSIAISLHNCYTIVINKITKHHII